MSTGTFFAGFSYEMNFFFKSGIQKSFKARLLLKFCFSIFGNFDISVLKSIHWLPFHIFLLPLYLFHFVIITFSFSTVKTITKPQQKFLLISSVYWSMLFVHVSACLSACLFVDMFTFHAISKWTFT